MSNLFSGINIALRALLTHQHAIQVIEHNVANANTPGYRRQEAVLAASTPYPRPGLYSGGFIAQFGSGVQVDSVRRFNIDFYAGRYRKEIAEYKRWELQGDVLRQVEATLAETSSDGLTAKLDAFWSGWQALSNDPANPTLRQDLQERSVNLTQAINHRAKALIAIRADQNQAIISRVDEINELAAQLARLNVEIANVRAAGSEPNDQLDERDRLLDRLAELSGAVSSEQENGDVMVSIGGHVLVVGTKTFKLATSSDPLVNDNLVSISWSDGQPMSIQRGELSGLVAARDKIIPDQMNGLNQLAYQIALQVNSVHQTGYDLHGHTGVPPGNPAGYEGNFFAPFTTTNYALEIQVSQEIRDDPANIAAASATTSPGDGSLAGAIANLQYQQVFNGGTATFNQFYSQKVAELGGELKSAINRAKDRKLVSDSLAMLNESVGGVSLDEEAANLVKAQRAFQAASRLVTTMDDMLDRIINGMGIVGR